MSSQEEQEDKEEGEVIAIKMCHLHVPFFFSEKSEEITMPVNYFIQEFKHRSPFLKNFVFLHFYVCVLDVNVWIHMYASLFCVL